MDTMRHEVKQRPAMGTKGRPSSNASCRPGAVRATSVAVDRPSSGDSTRSAGRLIVAAASPPKTATKPVARRAASTGYAAGVRGDLAKLSSANKASRNVSPPPSKTVAPKQATRSNGYASKLDVAPAPSTAASAAAPAGVAATDPVVSIDRKAEDECRAILVEALCTVPLFNPSDDVRAFHGRAFCLGDQAVDSEAAKPRTVWKSDKKPRQNSPDWLTATEYEEQPEVLRQKVRMLASLLRASHRTMAYTGAGLSVAAGIGMAAVGSTALQGMGVARAGEPTLSHCVMAELNRQNLLHGWVQQNHDGLPQKAGYRQEDINEIHGSWFDPANPVVKYSGCLRGDLCEDMETQAQTTDLVLVLGTSLTGLNADQCVEYTAARATKGKALGSVIISPQRTAQDGKASLRIFAKADDVMRMLAAEFSFGPRAFGRGARVKRSADLFTKCNKVLVPYDKNGNRSTKVQTYWDLSPGQKVRLGSNHNVKGAQQPQDQHITSKTLGTIAARDEKTCSIGVNFEGVNKKLGLWWLETAMRGGVAQLPFVNIDAQEMNC